MHSIQQAKAPARVRGHCTEWGSKAALATTELEGFLPTGSCSVLRFAETMCWPGQNAFLLWLRLNAFQMNLLERSRVGIIVPLSFLQCGFGLGEVVVVRISTYIFAPKSGAAAAAAVTSHHDSLLWLTAGRHCKRPWPCHVSHPEPFCFSNSFPTEWFSNNSWRLGTWSDHHIEKVPLKRGTTWKYR